jgi:DNA-binding Lrp family transcriptional regulator
MENRSHETKQDNRLSELDRKLLKILLTPNVQSKSTLSMSEEIGVPVSTIRRRRKLLESKFLKMIYVLDVEKFGWRRVDFFISIKKGLVDSVAQKLLEHNNVTYVGKSIGEHTIDLRVETIVKDNVSLLDLLEEIKGMDGVNEVVWSEIVSVVGRKISIPTSIRSNLSYNIGCNQLNRLSDEIIFPYYPLEILVN